LKYFIIAISVIFNFIFQSTIFQYFRIMDVAPNTSIIIIVTLALLFGKKTGAIVGLCIGLLQDVFFCDVIGVNTLIYFATGYIVGLTDKKVFKENLLLPFTFTGVTTISYHIIYFFFMYFLSINIHFIKLLKNVIFIEVIYNSVLSIFFYKQIIKLYNGTGINFRKRTRR